jgi:UDP-N-acetylmuramyl pentapeptide phosphotransferase/UDP-N-acetylglucosamine-1-phosphate transferase
MNNTRWIVVFEYGSGRVFISAEARANLMDGLDGLFSGFPASTLSLMQQGYAVPDSL